MSSPLRIGLLGWGNIGCGVIQAMEDNRDLLDHRCPRPLVLQRVADVDLERPRPVEVDSTLLTTDAEAVIADREIDVIIELIGGIEPARTFVEKAIHAGKHVVTANKAMLAQHGAELLAVAEKKGVRLLFEAAVGGGVPIIRALTDSLPANRLNRVEGILNGTCNYILTQMSAAGISFEDALADAQQRGYAEPDPTADIESIDAANKIAILASMAFRLDVRYGDVYRQAISDLTQQDLKAADAEGYVVKQRAVAELDEEGGFAISVRPTLIWKDYPLATVGDVLNGVLIEGRPVGAILLIGPGAGPQPTASAVLSDVIALSAFESGQSVPPPFLTMPLGHKPAKRVECACDGYCLRVVSDGDAHALADVTRILASHKIPVERISQEHWELDHEGESEAIRVHTAEVSERPLRDAIAELEQAAWRVDNAATLLLPRVERTTVPNWLGDVG